MSSRVLQWLSLVGIIWLQSINGTNFNFPSYSSHLKHHLSMSQLQLNNLAFASDAGKLFGFFSGLAANHLPLSAVLIIGSFLGLVGYGFQYLFITNLLHSPSYWVIFFLSVLAGNSFCWINTACYMIAVQNFSSYRQVAVGISTSYQGLSAKMYTNIVDSIPMFSERPSKRAEAFLLLNSVVPLGVCVLVSPLARVVKVVEEQGSLEAGFVVIFVITIATGFFAVVTSVGSISTKLSPLSGLVGILLFLALPLGVAVAEKKKESVRKVGDQNGEDEEIRTIRPKNEVKLERDDGKGAMEEIRAMQMVKRINFWLYFFVYFFGATIGLAFLNNLGQIAESRPSSNVSSLVSLLSSFGFFGRLMPSLLDYFFSRFQIHGCVYKRLSKYMKSRAGWVVVLMGPMCVGLFLLILCPTNASLYVSSAIIGVCTGAITTICVSITAELFGTNNFSINHNVVVANIPAGSFLYGYLAAFYYKNHTPPATTKCIGLQCYKTTFLLWGCFCCFGSLLALILFTRTRDFYSTKSHTLHYSQPNVQEPEACNL